MSIQNKIIESQHESVESHLKKKGIGSKRSVQQVVDTIQFEIQRNLRKFLIMLAVVVGFFGLLYFLGYQTEKVQGASFYSTPGAYIRNFLGFMNLIIIILSVGFGAQMLVIDFDQETGNILFPKISRGRLMIGRIVANFSLIACEIIMFYILIFGATFLKFKVIPVEFWYSLGWALFYALMVFAMTIFFSSFMGKPSLIVITILILMLIGFSIILGILSIVTSMEPFFLPNYYANIISYSLNMPAGIDEQRFILEIPDTGLTITTWLTPTYLTAAIGIGSYSLIFLIGAFLFYRRRQNK
jgi:hypothetical protein